MVNLKYKLSKTLTMLVNNFSSFPGKGHLIWISKWSRSRSLEGRGRQLRYKLPMGCVKPTTETEFSTIQHHYEPSGPTFEGLESPHSIDLVLGPLQELRESQWLCRDGELHPTNWTLVRNWLKKKKLSATQNDSFIELSQSLGVL